MLRNFNIPTASIALSGLLLFLYAVLMQSSDYKGSSLDSGGRVVIPAPILLFLYGGDRFFAANMETARLAATGVDFGQADMDYLVRAQAVVSELNPCHEDNYYLANGFLTWGGADQVGSSILKRAASCRFWDEYPAFFYGFNQFFFEKNLEQASLYLEMAARRSSQNAASFRKFAIMIRAEQIEDAELAIKFVESERDKSADAKLKDMLNKRVMRLKGLVLLRDAQRRFELLRGKKLESPEELLEAGLIDTLPDDPLRLGYEFIDHRFVLRQIKFSGAEEE
ncbi:hypothetical protein [Pseudomonas sp. TTU2014-080ASC]|uniref:hypothetical protein n=1 Tax=Pseudomonas sp. TTU2014-080ASC TaxID=1729724 RepID=UPI0007184F88|nr:hypothetical protein [Pseudomonas sp. TTU2014-080ASC]KRW62812.1 hypothetical protein AO726_05180 [Pseudomonas sp. TTU2014-080ASC]